MCVSGSRLEQDVSKKLKLKRDLEILHIARRFKKTKN